MPIVSLTLEEHSRSVLEQAYYKIVDDIIDTIKIPYGSLVIMHKDIDITKTDSNSNVSSMQKDNLPTTISKRRIIVNINEEYNEDALTTTAIHQTSAYPIFEDRDINVFVFPIYVKTDINIEFSYISPSKSEAVRIRDDIRLRLSQSRNINIHDIEYDILLPEVIETFISDIYDLKNRLVPQSLEDYFREHSTKRMHLLTDMSNPSNAKLAIKERQIRIIGLFDFSSMPDKLEIDNENNNYKLTFNYKLSMDIPKAIGMKYPVIVCNKVLDNKYIQFISDGKENSKEEKNRNLSYTKSLYALSHFESHLQLENRVNINLPINIPLFDDFHQRVVHKGYAVIASFLTDINESDNRTLFNLKDIDPYYINEELLEFIRTSEKEFIVNPYMSFMYIGLWQDDMHYDNNILTIEDDLTIKSKVDLQLFKPTRVLLSINIDISMLDPKMIDRLLANPSILKIYLTEYINAINNFKSEHSSISKYENNFYRFYILAINHYRVLENITIINDILAILSTDTYLYNNIINSLHSSYPQIFNYLYSNNLIDKNRSYNGFKSYNNDSDYGMKTVMTSYVIALKRK